MSNKKITERQVYMNGTYVPESDARISIFDSALMFGDMVFEMTRSFNQNQFKLKEHIDRLYDGIKILRINIDLTKDEMEEECNKVVEINNQLFNENDEHRLMINVSRGPLGIYAPIFNNRIEPTIVIADFPLKLTVRGFSRFFKTGINCVIPSQRAIPATLMDPKIKNRSRMWYQMGNIEVSEVKGDNNWALLIDPDGFIAEGTGNNFFIVKNGCVISPEGRNILRGISRDYIEHLCISNDLKYIEKNIEPYDVYNADEAFISGTPFCIMPVTSLNNIPIGDKQMGKITKHLLDVWSKNVGVDIIKQIELWDNDTSQLSSNELSSPYKFK